MSKLEQLEMRGGFTRRHIGPDRRQIREMANCLGLDDLEQIIDKAVPESILSQQQLALTRTISEREVGIRLRRMRRRNRVFTSMIGMGYHDTIMPAVIKRNVLENPAWYTAYTPYQAEISQGRLEALLNFQQMIIDLTGMEIANASMLDEATAAAEAMSMARRVGRSKSKRFFVDRDCHPQTIAVLRTRAHWFGYDLITGDPRTDLAGKDIFGALFQYPGSSGEVTDLREPIELAHKQGAIVTVAADILALVLLTAPGAMGADIVVGNTQRFGMPMGYGGPHAAFFASREKFVRSMPGRIIGVSVDNLGHSALRMALQTREQHIRREKATSNICTSQVLPAVIASFYAIYYGPKELRVIAERVHRLTQALAAGLQQLGYRIVNRRYFDTIRVHAPSRARRIAAKARAAQLNLRVYDADYLGIALDETTTRTELAAVWKVFAPAAEQRPDIDALDRELQECLPAELLREDTILQHPVFDLYHSETEMMRYMRWLARRDIALDRAMIPLGSCTMKLNAATELEALSYRDFNAIHPFVPLDQAQGYLQLFEELEDMLCDLTGFTAFSLQPNAGSQGEYTGLLVIRTYQQQQGQGERDVCLIPASAHGTNPASAVMAGLEVVVIACDEDGNIDLDDLRAKAERYTERLSALMVTYPSTHGVYEAGFLDICALVHECGGQVYLDGANMNALTGISRPAELGADVMHINLHKTFAIPHGGGGPGMGPIGVKQHLAPFLPDHPLVEGVNPAAGATSSVGAIAAAPWGSASILTISWAYIAMMGADGLRRATLVAILSANYIAARLREHYPILYTGKNGMVAHECILDLRPVRQSCNISVDDIAKRLVDYGFHAPTMSFPVPDTLMIEPTESENKRELDRFCDAMIAIRKEIARVEQGEWEHDNNPLKNAPHTHRLLLEPEWTMPYSKQEAFYPMDTIRDDKYWPPVSRVDNLHGDRNLFCSCPIPEEY